jgi:hypothetical protein
MTGPNTTATIYGLANIGVQDIWAVGSEGEIWKNSMFGWTKQEAGTGNHLRGMFISGLTAKTGKELWILGDDGAILSKPLSLITP